MTTNDKQTDYEAALRRLNDRFPPKPDPSPSPRQLLEAALDAAGLRLVVGNVWLTSGASHIRLSDILPESLRSFMVSVEVGAVPKESVSRLEDVG